MPKLLTTSQVSTAQADAQRVTQQTTQHETQRGARAQRAAPRGVAFWLVALTTAVLLGASSAASPLYPVWQSEYGFSAITLTAIFAVYVLTLLLSLLTVGRLSDYLGRRPVLAVALAVEAVAMAVFLSAEGVGWLYLARIVQGLATGAAMGALGAYLLDLQPVDGSRLGSLVNTVAPTVGLGAGAIGAGVLVQYAPHPTRLVFAVLTGLFVVLMLATGLLPETIERRPVGMGVLRPQVAVPSRARRALAGASPVIVATWALGGLILSIGGSLSESVFGIHDVALTGVLIGVFALSGSLASELGRDLSPRMSTRVGSAGLAVGAGLFLVSLVVPSLAVFVVAAVIAGGGFGLGFLGALRSVTQLAEPSERAALMSAVLIFSYIAFSIPALVAGLLITHIGLLNTALGYGGFVGVLALAGVVLDVVLQRRVTPAM